MASAHLFQREGARIVITGQDAQRLEAAKQELGANAIVIRSDAGKVTELPQLAVAIREQVANLDVLFLNAGIAKKVDTTWRN